MEQTVNRPKEQPRPATNLPNPLQDPLLSLLRRAVAERATDVHLDPVEEGKLVRFRVDGVVYDKPTIPLTDRGRLLNQIKIAANFNVEKCFRPQEGLIIYNHGQDTHDIRVTIAPIAGREAIHLRLLGAGPRQHQLDDLGLNQRDLQIVRDHLDAPSGMILVTGVTGAGKTSSLYAMANALDLRSKVTVSIEDPVEYRVSYVRQMQVDESRGVTMYEGLRALLRMDPDAIIVGEIRDKASAVTAARAALTGRLVLATLHARDATMAVTAMRNLSVPNYVLGGALRVIISQDLVRRLCACCTRAVDVSDWEKELFQRFGVPVPRHLRAPAGCGECVSYGYHGRTGVFEVIHIDQDLGDHIAGGLNQRELKQRFAQAVRRSLVADALHKAAAGLTSMEDAVSIYRGSQYNHVDDDSSNGHGRYDR